MRAVSCADKLPRIEIWGEFVARAKRRRVSDATAQADMDECEGELGCKLRAVDGHHARERDCARARSDDAVWRSESTHTTRWARTL
eukprot:6184287-Pleurochrysis_carterae.AAC.1